MRGQVGKPFITFTAIGVAGRACVLAAVLGAVACGGSKAPRPQVGGGGIDPAVPMGVAHADAAATDDGGNTPDPDQRPDVQSADALSDAQIDANVLTASDAGAHGSAGVSDAPVSTDVVSVAAPDAPAADAVTADTAHDAFTDAFTDSPVPMSPSEPVGPVCWKNTSGRGAGRVPANCGTKENDAGLCYPQCREGFNGVGPVCWERCPESYKDDGALCRRDAVIIASDNGSCPWYDKCGLTFRRGCSKCPDGFKNDGCTCRKDVHIFAKRSYGRGVGSVPGCDANDEKDGALCYRACGAGFDGNGPVCWQRCGGETPINCGAGCAVSQVECNKALASQTLVPVQTIVTALLTGSLVDLVTGTIDTFNTFNLPKCR